MIIVAGGTTVAQALPVVVTPILTRMYSPSDMGQLALYIAFISFVSGVITLGFAMAIVSAFNAKDAAVLAMLSYTSIPILSLGFTGLLMVLQSESLLGFGNLPVWSGPIMFISLILTGLFSTCRYWQLRKSQYQMISAAAIGQGIGRTGAQLGLGIWGLGVSGLILSEVVGRGAGLYQLWTRSWPEIKSNACPLTLSRLLATANIYRKFPLVSAPSSLINSLVLVLPTSLVVAEFGVAEGGQYAVATRVLLLPLSLIGSSVGDVFFSRMAQHSRENHGSAIRLFLQVAAGLFLLGAPLMLMVALFGSTIWPLVLGDQWTEAGLIAAALAPWALMQLAVSPVSRVVAIYQSQEVKLVYDLFGLVVVIGTFSISSRLDWGLVETCAALGWLQALSYLIYFLLLVWVVRREGGRTT